jgi:hypothetical protein
MISNGTDFRIPCAETSPVPLRVAFETSPQFSNRTASPAVFIRGTLAAMGLPIVSVNSAALNGNRISVASSISLTISMRAPLSNV